MEHENRHVARVLLVGSDEECTQRLAVWRWNKQLFIVGNGELRGSGYVRSSIWWEGAWVYDFAGAVSRLRRRPSNVLYFCLKYKRPLSRAATPEDASSGMRR